ncbi:MAG: hypothetical protein KGJ01_02625 [Patescibacteria group bacterium]|nr:hypothetical protein [Patescibacteria group bacterium]
MKGLKGILAALAVILSLIAPSVAAASAPAPSFDSLEQQITTLQQEIVTLSNSIFDENVALLHENNPKVLYGDESAYKDAKGTTHVSVLLSSMNLTNAPYAPFGTTLIEVNALASLLNSLNIKTTVSTPSNPEDITLRAITADNHWLFWRAGDKFVTTSHGKVSLTGEQMASLGGDPGYAMTAFYPLRETVSLLGGKITYNPLNQGIAITFAG